MHKASVVPLKNGHSTLIRATGYFSLDSLIRVTSNSFPNICSSDTKSLLTTTRVQPVSLKTLTSFPFTVLPPSVIWILENRKYPCYPYGDSPYKYQLGRAFKHDTRYALPYLYFVLPLLYKS